MKNAFSWITCQHLGKVKRGHSSSWGFFVLNHIINRCVWLCCQWPSVCSISGLETHTYKQNACTHAQEPTHTHTHTSCLWGNPKPWVLCSCSPPSPWNWSEHLDSHINWFYSSNFFICKLTAQNQISLLQTHIYLQQEQKCELDYYLHTFKGCLELSLMEPLCFFFSLLQL